MLQLFQCVLFLLSVLQFVFFCCCGKLCASVAVFSVFSIIRVGLCFFDWFLYIWMLFSGVCHVVFQLLFDMMKFEIGSLRLKTEKFQCLSSSSGFSHCVSVFSVSNCFTNKKGSGALFFFNRKLVLLDLVRRSFYLVRCCRSQFPKKVLLYLVFFFCCNQFRLLSVLQIMILYPFFFVNFMNLSNQCRRLYNTSFLLFFCEGKFLNFVLGLVPFNVFGGFDNTKLFQ